MIVKKEDKKLQGIIYLPASKSISNRLLMLKAISGKDFNISNLSEADDTKLLSDHLAVIAQNTKIKSTQITALDCDNAGTVIRFLTAYLSSTTGTWLLSGSEQMKKRPIAILINALRELGASINYLNEDGFPPLLIKGNQLRGGSIEMNAGISSQYISALLMIAPSLPGGLTIKLSGNLISMPYIKLTISLMESFGIQISFSGNKITVGEQKFKANDSMVESDWSAASYWYQMAALADEVDVTLIGLKDTRTQGDSVVSHIFRNFGIETEYLSNGVRITKKRKTIHRMYLNFADFPDIAPTVIATCAGMGVDEIFFGLGSLHIKETDRIKALETELTKIGCHFAGCEHSDVWYLKKEKGCESRQISFNTYDDHRMAMALAPLALKFGQISIANPEVVSKSYPGFWNDIQSVGFQLIK